MDCPRCKGKSKVLDSRTQPDSSTRRKRKCLTCGAGYWTLERLSSDWEKKVVATPTKQPQTTLKKSTLRQSAPPRKPMNKMTDEELENAIFEGELRFDEDEL